MVDWSCYAMMCCSSVCCLSSVLSSVMYVCTVAKWYGVGTRELAMVPLDRALDSSVGCQ